MINGAWVAGDVKGVAGWEIEGGGGRVGVGGWGGGRGGVAEALSPLRVRDERGVARG